MKRMTRELEETRDSIRKAREATGAEHGGDGGGEEGMAGWLEDVDARLGVVLRNLKDGVYDLGEEFGEELDELSGKLSFTRDEVRETRRNLTGGDVEDWVDRQLERSDRVIEDMVNRLRRLQEK